jgi:hypothetical protein
MKKAMMAVPLPALRRLGRRPFVPAAPLRPVKRGNVVLLGNTFGPSLIVDPSLWTEGLGTALSVSGHSRNIP